MRVDEKGREERRAVVLGAFRVVVALLVSRGVHDEGEDDIDTDNDEDEVR